MTDLEYKSVFDPKPGSAQENATLGPFKIGSRVVQIDYDPRDCSGVWCRTRKNGQLVDILKVGKVITIDTTAGTILVSSDQALYINLKPDRLRLATEEEIQIDLWQRRDRQMKIEEYPRLVAKESLQKR